MNVAIQRDRYGVYCIEPVSRQHRGRIEGMSEYIRSMGIVPERAWRKLDRGWPATFRVPATVWYEITDGEKVEVF